MISQKRWIIQMVTVSLLALVALAALTFGNYRYSLASPGGNDFLVHWVGARALLVDGVSPYGDDVAVDIQTMAYGRPALKGEHELRVAYPLYSALVFLPFSLISDFTLARAAWMTALEVGLIFLALLSIRLAQWKPSTGLMVALLLFTIFWYHGARALINGNAVILVALGMVGGFLALRNGSEETAGVLFALTTIKPQVMLIPVGLVLLWAFTQRKYRVIGWFAGAMFLLVAGAALFVPDWILQFLREVLRYPSYNPPGTPAAVFASWWPAFGQRVGLALSGATILLLAVEWNASRKYDFRGLAWFFCLSLALSPWVGIMTDPGNFITLLPALVLAFRYLDDRWGKAGPWATTLMLVILGVGLWWIFLKTVGSGPNPMQSPVMFFPTVIATTLALYWVRWWAVKPPNVWIDQIDF